MNNGGIHILQCLFYQLTLANTSPPIYQQGLCTITSQLLSDNSQLMLTTYEPHILTTLLK